MFILANAFVDYSNKQVTFDQTFLLFLKTLYVAALAQCMISEARKDNIEIFIEAIRLSAYSTKLCVNEEGCYGSDKDC